MILCFRSVHLLPHKLVEPTQDTPSTMGRSHLEGFTVASVTFIPKEANKKTTLKDLTYIDPSLIYY